MSTNELRILRSETLVKEVWSRLSYFEREDNAREFLKKFGLLNDESGDIASAHREKLLKT